MRKIDVLSTYFKQNDMKQTIQELIEAIESASNVMFVEYDKAIGKWRITYYKGEEDQVGTEDLIEFLTNA